ncbi:lymphocyte specific protein 1 b isoform X2 [Paramisgurnus dabryanus]|uniref:lymphocyte specific protein 1 b isoform X2 n=1 Tax=Paramisgurnus dabryanus TaxID=90735 RepID=UPI0031F40DF6
MSTSILRRHSSKKGLQNLQRITAQRSLEDAEEIERERRRRLRSSSSTDPETTVTQQDAPLNAQILDNQGQIDLVPRYPSSLEEDEGFSDWTQQLSRRKQKQMEHQDVEAHLNGSHQSRLQPCSNSAQQSKLHQNDFNMYDAAPLKQIRSPLLNQKNLDEDNDDKDCGARERERQDNVTTERKEREFSSWYDEEESPKRMTENLSSSCRRDNQGCDMDEKVMEKKAEMKISFTSKVLLQQNGRSNSTNGQEESQITESVSEDVFAKSSDDNQEQKDTGHQTQEGVQRWMIEEERDKRRRDVMEKLKRLSISSGDPEEPFSPLSPKSPTHMIAERTESLNRSVKKKSSIKRTQPPTMISKLDGRLEQYNHAVEECIKEGNAAKQPLMDVPTPEEPVSARKTLFEAGEAFTSVKATPSKDTEGIKVGVADLINQWVKGNSDVNKCPSSKVVDVKAGEVRSIKSMWENMGDTSPQDISYAKGSGGKKYKFVESGHGKYEKVLDERN